MKLRSLPPVDLTYCLNIHPGETADDLERAIAGPACTVRDRVGRGRPFGLGLRVSRQAATELLQPGRLERIRALLGERDLYAFTINGFPFGSFHAQRVKEKVYAPDWTSAERRDYTNDLATILAALLPEGMEGSISTVPVSFKPWVQGEGGARVAAANLLECAGHLRRVEEETGRHIHLGLEPEPACYLETTSECIGFFDRHLREGAARTHLGVCFDTCHVAVEHEDPCEAWDRYVAAEILISKVQISAALACRAEEASIRALQPFCEPVYFHQTLLRPPEGAIAAWTDLPDALADPRARAGGELRVHFHVPLFWEGAGALRSTSATLTRPFFERLASGACPHLEIETYTFDVLPPALRGVGVAESIAREYEWVLPRLEAGISR
jgi:sugar phosphate isomerase/epimerase